MEVLQELLKKWNAISRVAYTAVTFTSVDRHNQTIYHTDCMMTLLGNDAIVCTEAIATDELRDMVISALRAGKHAYQIIDISLE